MLKKTVNYTDYNGEKRTEDVYFNLNELEVVELALDLPDELTDGVSENTSEQAVAAQMLEKLGRKGIIEFIKSLMKKSYGVKSEDGRSFVKTEKMAEEFTHTAVYSAIITEVMTNDVAAANFVNAIIPADLAAKLAESKSVRSVTALPETK